MTGRLWLVAAATMMGLVTRAEALPPLPKYLKDALADKAEVKEFAAKVDALESKCDVCHIPKADKKAKGHGLNDFGQAFHKHLKDKEFMAAHKEKKTDEAMKLFTDAWGKVVDEKNAEGKTFGELIKAGQLPGKNN